MGDDIPSTVGMWLNGTAGDWWQASEAQELTIEPDHGLALSPSWRALTETYSGQISMEAMPAKAINMVLGFNERTSPIALSFMHSCRRTVRHRRIWQYRRERKGDKGKRRGYPRHERYEILTVLPDVRIKGAERLWSADAEAPVTVEFEVGGANERLVARHAWLRVRPAGYGRPDVWGCLRGIRPA